MAETDFKRADARRHIQQARFLLMSAGTREAAAHLDHALASLDGVEVGCDDDDRPGASTPTDPAVVRAMGGAMTIMGTILARSDLVPLDELGRLFDLYASVSAHDDPAVGTIVQRWGDMIANVAAGIDRLGRGPEQGEG